MKHLFFFCTSLLCTFFLFSQYQPIDKRSKIEFKIKNLGFTVNGSFSGISGRIFFNPQDLSASKIDVSVDASSVNTDNSMRDDHLKSESYFDVKKYPRISFISTRIVAARGGSFLVSGKLKIKNTIKDISFLFSVTQVGEGLRLKGSFAINRRDFDVGGLSIISDMLTVNLDVVANK